MERDGYRVLNKSWCKKDRGSLTRVGERRIKRELNKIWNEKNRDS